MVVNVELSTISASCWANIFKYQCGIWTYVALSSTFMVPQNASPIHTHFNTLQGGCCHARPCQPHWEQLRFSVLLKDTSACGQLEEGIGLPTL